MIEIICGTYGYRPNKNAVELKRPGDPPFCLTEKQEASLIRKGIARRVFSDAPLLQEPGGSSDDPPLYDDTMKLVELKEVAQVYGVDEEIVAPLRSKAEVIAAIDQKLAEDAGGNDGADDDSNASDQEPGSDAPPLNPENPMI